MTATTPLSRDRILACAVRVADRDGLEAASLRRIAGELGVHVTSIYHHVPTKEALLDGIVEGAVRSDHQVMIQPLLTLAVAGGQKVVDALRYQAP